MSRPERSSHSAAGFQLFSGVWYGYANPLETPPPLGRPAWGMVGLALGGQDHHPPLWAAEGTIHHTPEKVGTQASNINKTTKKLESRITFLFASLFRRAVLPSLPWVVCSFLSFFFARRTSGNPAVSCLGLNQVCLSHPVCFPFLFSLQHPLFSSLFSRENCVEIVNFLALSRVV